MGNFVIVRKFNKPVVWEFNCRLQGEGENCREALLNALSKKYGDVRDCSLQVIEAIERNETWIVNGEWAQNEESRAVRARGRIRTSYDNFCLQVQRAFRRLRTFRFQ